MNGKQIGYWAVTGLFGLAYFASGMGDIFHASPMVTTLTKLGYPLYVLSILGPWKIAGVVTLLAPKFPRLKEWAYAGIAFDLTGGLASHILNGDPAVKFIPPIVFLSLALTSWFLRPANRRLADTVTSDVSDGGRVVSGIPAAAN